MESNPRIVFRMGKKIYLRPIAKKDLPFITQGINDEQVTMNLTVAYPMSIEREESWFESLQKGNSDVVLAVIEKETDAFVGLIGLHDIKHINGTATTGFWLLREFWSKGYGTEAISLLLKYGFETLNLRKIKSSVYDFNEKSIKLHKKLGYTQEGVLKAHNYRNGQYVDQIIYGLFREDFEEALTRLA